MTRPQTCSYLICAQMFTVLVRIFSYYYFHASIFVHRNSLERVINYYPCSGGYKEIALEIFFEIVCALN